MGRSIVAGRVTARSLARHVGVFLFAGWASALAQPVPAGGDTEAASPSDGAAPPTGSSPAPDATEETSDGAAHTAGPHESGAEGSATAAPIESWSVAPITAELLSLCSSSDPVARAYCLAQLEHTARLPPPARDVIAELAATDPDLSERARSLYRRTFGTDPPPYSPPPATAAVREEPETPAPRASGDPTRVIYAPTAFTRPRGKVGFNAFELGTVTVDFGVTDHLELGAQTAIPIAFVTVGGVIKAGVPFEGGAVAIRGNVLLIRPLGSETEVVAVYGAGPMLTLGDYADYLNLGMHVYGLSVDGETESLGLPNLGGSVRVSGATRLSAELYIPTGLRQDAEPPLARFGLILWGVRLFGEHVWGDIALADPICDGCSDLYELIPLGIPLLNIGGAW